MNSWSLIEFLRRTKTHIATTNYDNLLYQKLIEGQVLRGYDGALVDGLVNASFRSDNLDRLRGRDFGFYLHLHGSPLFVDVNGAIVKQQQPTAFPHPTPHLVLTHFKHKPFVIASSYLLSNYWWRFSQAIKEALADSGRITVFGYSGMDEHLNRELHGHADKVRVVEWHDGATDDEDWLEFWRDRLGGPIELVREENILDFQEWE